MTWAKSALLDDTCMPASCLLCSRCLCSCQPSSSPHELESESAGAESKRPAAPAGSSTQPTGAKPALAPGSSHSAINYDRFNNIDTSDDDEPA